MMEYCEVINPDSFYSKIVSIDTALEFFGFFSVSVFDETKYKSDLYRMKMIIENSFQDEPEM